MIIDMFSRKRDAKAARMIAFLKVYVLAYMFIKETS